MVISFVILTLDYNIEQIEKARQKYELLFVIH
ncbi:hypothetical protein A3Q56_08254, partial [Intoshia linei]